MLIDIDDAAILDLRLTLAVAADTIGFPDLSGVPCPLRDKNTLQVVLLLLAQLFFLLQLIDLLLPCQPIIHPVLSAVDPLLRRQSQATCVRVRAFLEEVLRADDCRIYYVDEGEFTSLVKVDSIGPIMLVQEVVAVEAGVVTHVEHVARVLLRHLQRTHALLLLSFLLREHLIRARLYDNKKCAIS